MGFVNASVCTFLMMVLIFFAFFPLLVHSRKQDYFNVLTVVFISIVKDFAAYY